MSKRNSAYYQDVFHKINEGKVFTWNWAAFFFGYIWFAYRKMYAVSFLICLTYTIFLTCIFFSVFLNVEDTFSGDVTYIVVVILIKLFYGLFGNKLYYNHIQYKIKDNYGLLAVKPVDITSTILLILNAAYYQFSDHTKFNENIDKYYDQGHEIAYVIGYQFVLICAGYGWLFLRWLYETYQLRQLKKQIHNEETVEQRIIY